MIALEQHLMSLDEANGDDIATGSDTSVDVASAGGGSRVFSGAVAALAVEIQQLVGDMISL